MAINLGMDVLIVDDYTTMLRIIRNLLKQLGFYNIDEASDGGMALDKMKSKRYSLIISDWKMDPMNGYEFLNEVRSADAPYKDTPFIMVSVESKSENVIAAKQAGVNSYMVKPFSAGALKARIEAALANS